ncbi:Asp-tRNA(Asn)/Glu-tRNA(Gln) amidotransferase subunit GatC [SAR86 cluster bacterium]|jgi:aspartyl-tRNA(Asn)/glutamyl-tRNA(Gln) amidotransferase subunit C|uniref:Aspartyl/glutamyl-tRNA(Asn/Gln) amidotransferase subunit C n=1 Tax=SAR86 cluster bacterium TaxID=2030880 RepID=A0A9Q8TZ32_9GAMM|nr:Asp-tRNA(Asn)/Glu-tRNA(Gln) amidotransferase subunit GatC [SAR86 cluster bacterium]|tara:strand:+ start:282 stop:563 length:282 start_codon:yes stop_codon:yes gene_type:complete
MNKIELKNLLFLSRLQVNDKDHDKTIEKLQNTFEMIDQMNDLDLDKFEPLNNPLELTNVSRSDVEKNRNKKEEFLESSPKSDENYFVVPKIVE